jgi:hypothetical protein
MSLNSYQNVDRIALAKNLDAIHKETLSPYRQSGFQALKKDGALGTAMLITRLWYRMDFS